MPTRIPSSCVPIHGPFGYVGSCTRSSALWKFIGIAIGTLGSLYVIRKIFDFKRKVKLRKKWNEVGKDVVVLHQFWNGKYCPRLSPFVAKVEIFLRIYGIKYRRDITTPFGPTNLCPWITFNGKDISDTQVIAEHLAEHFGLDLYPNLKRERIAVLENARLMVEEHLYWILYAQRYYYDGGRTFVETQSFPRWFLRYYFLYWMPRKAYKRVKSQGVLNISQDRQIELYRRALDNMDATLGDMKYFGGTEPCIADCTIFGLLMQIVWNCPGTIFELMIKDFPRLTKYCLVMKERVYPDWDKVLVPPKLKRK